MTVADVLASARELRGHSKRTTEIDLWILRTLGKHPAEATTADLEAIILRNRSAASRATYARRIRSIFKLLRDLGAIPADCTPDLALPVLKSPRGTPRPFTPDQLHRLRTEARQPLRDVFIVASLTGLRSMELLALEGRDLEDGIHGPQIRVIGKGRKEALIPAHPVVVELIESRRTLGRIFPAWSSPTALSAAASVEIKRILGFGTLHMIRHSYATQLLEATSDIALVASLMRHSSVSSTQIYCQVASSRQRQAIDLLAG